MDSNEPDYVTEILTTAGFNSEVRAGLSARTNELLVEYTNAIIGKLLKLKPVSVVDTTALLLTLSAEEFSDPQGKLKKIARSAENYKQKNPYRLIPEMEADELIYYFSILQKNSAMRKDEPVAFRHYFQAKDKKFHPEEECVMAFRRELGEKNYPDIDNVMAKMNDFLSQGKKLPQHTRHGLKK